MHGLLYQGPTIIIEQNVVLASMVVHQHGRLVDGDGYQPARWQAEINRGFLPFFVVAVAVTTKAPDILQDHTSRSGLLRIPSTKEKGRVLARNARGCRC